VIEDRKLKIRDHLFYAYRNLQRGVRTDDNWKLIKYQVDNTETTQLFNLNDDPWEVSNLADDPDYSGKLNELTHLLDQEMRKYDDPMDLEKEFWGKEEIFIPEKRVQHLAVGKTINLMTQYSGKYTGGGDGALVDGVHGLLDINDPAWQGYEGTNLELIVDLGDQMKLETIAIRFLQDAGAWVFLPEFVEVGISDNGESFETLHHIVHDIKQRTDEKLIHDFTGKGENLETRYIRIMAKNIGTCPDWHPGAGGKAWIFADEIVIR
jgi:hypothetical protein